MNITFLIGNGFDIGLDLKTRYEDFYKIYCQSDKGDSHNILEFKGMLMDRQKGTDNNSENKIIDWSDFEKAFGEHSKDFTLEYKGDYIERFEDFITKFNLYLENEEQKIDYSNTSDIVTTMKNAVTTYYHIRRGDKKEIENHYKAVSGQRVYNFISFNYTKSVDECANIFKESLKNDSSRKVGEICHIHGYVEENMILGVNDVSQITNPDFANDIDVVSEIVKPQQNIDARTMYEDTVISLINSSSIICVYGMSIGATDKKWWNLISKWLSTNSSRQLVILEHSTDYDSRFPHAQRKVVKTTTEKFLSFSDLSEDKKIDIAKRIFVGVNNDVFSMKLHKEKSENITGEKTFAVV